MLSSAQKILVAILPLLVVHSAIVLAQCSTDQNPYCAGNNQFEQICCTYPNVCYWSNRNGDPACCPAGTDCSGDGGPTGIVSQVQATTIYIQTTYLSTQSLVVSTSTPELTSLSTVTTPAVVVVTNTFAVETTVPMQTPTGAFVTVTQVQVVAGGSSNRDTRAHAAILAVSLICTTLAYYLI